MDSTRAWRPLLIELMQGKTEEPAARLRQLLISEGQNRGLGSFDHQAMGYRRFKDFLAAFPDLFELRTREGGEMIVCPQSISESTPANSASVSVRREPSSAIRDEVWIAFSNPDPRRARFFNRLDGRVFHTLIQEGQSPDSLRPPGDWVRIEQIGAELQSTWMKEFVSEHPDVPPAVPPMLEETYSTPLNVRFTRSLGPLGKAWTQFRLRKMIQQIHSWAATVEVPISRLSPASVPTHAVYTAARPAPLPVVDTYALSAKERALRLIDTLSEDEIANYVIPLMASVLMVKARQ